MLEKNIFIIIRNDDLCALSDPAKERKVFELFEKYDIPQVISVIPKMTEDPHNSLQNQYHRLDENPEIVALLKEFHAKGLIEIAQHGYTHQTNAFHPSKKEKITTNDYFQGIDRKWLAFSPANPRRYSEFNGLSYDEKKDKIVCGRQLLEEVLKTKVETFAFPWDNLDQQCLEVLGDCAFNTVLCTDNTYKSGNLNLITCCHNDIFSLSGLIKEMEALKKPVLTHIEYHSWMLSGDELQRLDHILGELSSNPNIKMIRASQVQEFLPDFKEIWDLKCRLDTLTDQANVFLGKGIKTTKYFVFDKVYYTRKILKTWIINFLAGSIGYKKALAISGVTLAAFVAFKSIDDFKYQYNTFDMAALIFLSSLFLFILYLNLKGKFYAQRTGH